mgnify:CR=1 FL=1
MPSFSEYKVIARSRGALAFEVYVAESTAIVEPASLQETLPAHLDYQKSLEARGALVFAGPLSDTAGKGMSGGGLIVYRADSLEAARALAEADPMHRDGKRSFTLRRWLINEGSLTVSLELSKQAIALR